MLDDPGSLVEKALQNIAPQDPFASVPTEIVETLPDIRDLFDPGKQKFFEVISEPEGAEEGYEGNYWEDEE